jgi:hypothetical protein
MQRTPRMTGARAAISRRVLVASGVMFAFVFVLSADTSTAATIDPPAGTWAPVSSPIATHSSLASVSCVTSTDCWAVGSSEPGQLNNSDTLSEDWNGDTWTIVSTPDVTGDSTNQLKSIDCVSTTDCWAVGYSFSSATETSSVLIENWDGTDWSIVVSPLFTGASGLASVTCLSSIDCWAVGTGPDGAMSEQWDGFEWTVVSVPNGMLGNDSEPTYLTGVNCVSAEDCWAVGNLTYFLGPSEILLPVFEQWNGSWSATTVAGSGGGDGLTGVTCVSASDCWAVGSLATGSGGNDQTLTERWNGAQWSAVTSANTSASAPDHLFGVTCNSSTDCWAVGDVSGYDSPPSPALAEHWGGSTWSIVTSDQVSSKQNYGLSSVTCADATDCWSVGSSGETVRTSVSSQALVEWLGPPTSISISPSGGPSGAPVTVNGVGFAFDKPVKVVYQSGVSGKVAATNLHCDTSTTINGAFSCRVSIPVRNAGSLGPHTVTATSKGSTASSPFDLT